MKQFILACFGWLPLPLQALIGTIVGIFFLLVVFDVVKLVFELLKFLLDILGGFFGKVVTIFV